MAYVKMPATKPATSIPTKKGGPCSCYFQTIGLIISIFVCTAIALRQSYTNMWGSDFGDYHTGDQISVRHAGFKINTILCSAYDVNPWSTARIYQLPSQAEYSQQQRTVHTTDSGLTSGDSYDYVGFYLLPGSNIHVNACSFDGGLYPFQNSQVLVVKGEDSWQAWKHDKNPSVAIQRFVLTLSDLCSYDRPKVLDLLITDEDHYYVALARENISTLSKPVSVNFDLTVRRTMYNLNGARELCVGLLSCHVNVAYNSDGDVVVEFNDHLSSSGLKDWSADFTFRCESRLMVWIGVFLILPLGLIVLVTSCCCCCFLCDRYAQSSNLKRKRADSKAALVNRSLPPSYDSVFGTAVQVA